MKPTDFSYIRYGCTLSKGNRRTGVNGVAISLDRAGAKVVSGSVLDAKAIIFMGDIMSIGIEKFKFCDDGIDGNRLGVGREIEAIS